MTIINLLILLISCTTAYMWGRMDEHDKWIDINRKLEQKLNQHE